MEWWNIEGRLEELRKRVEAGDSSNPALLRAMLLELISLMSDIASEAKSNRR